MDRKCLMGLWVLTLATLGSAQSFDPANYSDLKWTNVGPNRGGRSIACTGVRSRPNEFYFGATGGGVWKTTDGGNSWNCVSDGFFKTSSVGAIAVSESNPDVVYAGMGEREIRGNATEGDGLYKSTDSGKTWTHVGLESTRTISRIVIDPKNPDIVYVAALGQIFGPNPDRGIFKSTDGGKTWRKVLFESEKAGAVELVMDPHDSNTLYAATWEAWRTPYTFNSGGPGSKLWKSTDAGEHWTDISHNQGLPTGILGKIGISVSPVDNKRVYAIVESHHSAVYRSDDAGQTWSVMSDESDLVQRPWYFHHVYADPKELDTVYCLNVGAMKSADGGKTWKYFGTPHSDNHDLWISPDDSKLMIEANDGGASVTKDGGGNWTRQNYPTAQIYHVVADNSVPYKIYGAQQDNSSLRITPFQQVAPGAREFDFGPAGESGYIAVRWDDPDVAYGGNYGGDLSEMNYRTNVRRQIDPWPDNPMGHGAAEIKHRFQWTFPIVTSPNDPNILYTASQYLLKTTNRGQSWEVISPDLTRNDKSKQAPAGGPLTKDNTSVEYYDTIFTVAESPRKPGVIWVGSDDGLVHVTTNGGKAWKNVTPSGLPEWARISMIEPGQFDAGTAYVAANNYQNEDTAPYIYRTHDYGRTWSKIVNGIASDAFARVCREDIRRPGLLYAGTESGVYASFDDGNHWQPLQLNLPLTPVHDLFLKDDDLIAATHGRSFWILRGLSRLSNLSGSEPTTPVLYQPQPKMRTFGVRPSFDYYLPADAKEVTFRVLDRGGNEVGTATGDAKKGFHTVATSLAHPPFGTFQGMIMWAGFPASIPVPPGDYQIEMTVDGYKSTKRLRVLRDRLVLGSDKDLVEQYNFAVQISARVSEANAAVLRIRDLKSQVDEAIKAANGDTSVAAQGEALNDKLTSVEGEIYQYRSHSGEDPLNYPIKLNDKLAGVLSTVLGNQAAPTKQARQVFAELSGELQVQLDRLKAIEGNDVAELNNLLKAKGIKPVEPKTPPFDSSPRRRGGSEEGVEEKGDS